MKNISKKQRRIFSLVMSILMFLTSIQYNGMNVKAEEDLTWYEVIASNQASISSSKEEIIFGDGVTTVDVSKISDSNLKAVAFLGKTTTVSNKFSSSSIKVWCYQGSEAEKWAKSIGLTPYYLNTKELQINYGSEDDKTKFTGCDNFDIKTTTKLDDGTSVFEGDHYSCDVVWETSDPSVITFVLNGEETTKLNSADLLEYENTKSKIVENNLTHEADISATLKVKATGTATITARSRSGKTNSVTYTVKKGADSIGVSVDIYKVIKEKASEDSQELVAKVKKVNPEDESSIDCYVYLEKIETEHFKDYASFTNNSAYDELKVDKDCYFVIHTDMKNSSEDVATLSLKTSNEVIDPYKKTYDQNTAGVNGMRVVGFVDKDGNNITGEVDRGNNSLFYADVSTGNKIPFTINCISRNNVIQRKVNVYVCQSTEEPKFILDGLEIVNGAGYEKKTTDNLALEADFGNSTDTIEWSVSNTNVAHIASGSEHGFTTNITVDSAGTFDIICSALDFKDGTVNSTYTFRILASALVPYDGLGFTDKDGEGKKLVTEYKIPTNSTDNKVYVANVKDKVLYNGSKDKIPNETLIYSSDNTDLVTINSETGFMTAGEKTGTTTINVSTKGNGKSASIPVTVYAPAKVINTKDFFEVPEGQTRDFDVSVEPENSIETINWATNNNNYVTAEEVYDEKGNRKIRIHALKKTTSNVGIIGKTELTGITKNVYVSVSEPVHADTVSIAVDANSSFTTDADGNVVVKIAKGVNSTISPVLTSATGKTVNDQVAWLVESGKDIVNATVNSNDGLNIVANAAGTATITLRAYGGNVSKEIKCKIEVYVPAQNINIVVNGSTADEASIEVGSIVSNICVNLTPSDSTDLVNWSVEESDILALSKTQTSGSETIAISALKTGTAHLKAETSSKVVDTVTIHVIKTADKIEFVKDGNVIENNVYVNLGSTTKLELKVTGENTTDDSFTWSTPNNSGFIKVTPDEKGVSATINANFPGTQTVSVTAPSGKVASINVIVVQPATSIEVSPVEATVIKGDQPISVIANLGPANTTDQVTWTVDKEDIITWTEATDSSVTNTQKHIYVSAVGAGKVNLTATTVSGKTATIAITAEAKQLTKETVKVQVSDMEFTGAEIKPTAYVYYNNSTLTMDTDYEVEYSDNINVGVATVKIIGKGNYAGEYTANFNITGKAISSLQIAKIDDYVYSGKAYTPDVVIVNSSSGNNITLNKDVDYTLEYDSNINAGNCNVKITGKGNYTGETLTYFSIAQKPLTSDDISVSSIADYTYNFNSVSPSVVVKDGTVQLKADKDYGVSYNNNAAVGTANVVITGYGNYTGEVLKNFKIVAKSISAAKVIGLQNVVYTGKAITQNVTVYLGKNYLSLGTDYKITYSNNKKVGKAALKITGIGNFKGSKTVNFVILPTVPKKASMKSSTTNSINLTWSKVTGASGYVISVFDQKKQKYKKVATSTKNSVTLKKLAAGTINIYAISSYIKVGSKTYVSTEIVNAEAGTKVAASKIKKLSSSIQDLTVTFSKVKNADGYAIYTSTKKNGKYKIATTAASTDTTAYLFGLKSKSNVYVKVGAFKTIAGKNYYSMSSAKKVKIK